MDIKKATQHLIYLLVENRKTGRERIKITQLRLQHLLFMANGFNYLENGKLMFDNNEFKMNRKGMFNQTVVNYLEDSVSTIDYIKKDGDIDFVRIKELLREFASVVDGINLKLSEEFIPQAEQDKLELKVLNETFERYLDYTDHELYDEIMESRPFIVMYHDMFCTAEVYQEKRNENGELVKNRKGEVIRNILFKDIFRKGFGQIDFYKSIDINLETIKKFFIKAFSWDTKEDVEISSENK